MTLSRRPFNDLQIAATERGDTRGLAWTCYITGHINRSQFNRVVYHS